MTSSLIFRFMTRKKAGVYKRPHQWTPRTVSRGTSSGARPPTVFTLICLTGANITTAGHFGNYIITATVLCSIFWNCSHLIDGTNTVTTARSKNNPPLLSGLHCPPAVPPWSIAPDSGSRQWSCSLVFFYQSMVVLKNDICVLLTVASVCIRLHA